MSFTFTRRPAQFGVFNLRREKHGDEPHPAIDLPITIGLTKRDLVKLLPVDEKNTGTSLIHGFWDSKGNWQGHSFDHLALCRNPEGISVLIIDRALTDPKKKNPGKDEAIRFEGAKIKSPVLSEFEGNYRCSLSFKLQISDIGDDIYPRLVRLIDEYRTVQIDQPQTDLFEDANADGDDNGDAE